MHPSRADPQQQQGDSGASSAASSSNRPPNISTPRTNNPTVIDVLNTTPKLPDYDSFPTAAAAANNSSTAQQQQQQNHTVPRTASAQDTRSTVARRIITALMLLLMFIKFFSGTVLTLFQYHPLLMLLGFVGILPELLHAARSIRRSRSFAERSGLLKRHLCLALCLKVVAVAGFLVILINKANHKKAHCTTWHGLIGAICVGLVVLQVILGLFQYVRYSPRWFPNFLVHARTAHTWLGICVTVLACTSVFLGMMSNFAKFAVENPVLHGAFTFSATTVCVWAFVKE